MVHSGTLGFSLVVCLTLLTLGIWLSIETTGLYTTYLLYEKYHAKYDGILKAFGETTSIFLSLLVICLIIAFCLLNRAIKVANEKRPDSSNVLDTSRMSVNSEADLEEEKPSKPKSRRK